MLSVLQEYLDKLCAKKLKMPRDTDAAASRSSVLLYYIIRNYCTVSSLCSAELTFTTVSRTIPFFLLRGTLEPDSEL